MTENVRIAEPIEPPAFARSRVNLADARLGARAIAASDQFFAPLERMLNPEPARFYPDRFDDHGKWMDGWETRRRRNGGHDWAIIRLALPGRISGLDIDTSFFTGNFPPAASVEACLSSEGTPGPDAVWTEILPATALRGDDHRFVAVEHDQVVTHLRVNIYPDGGIARLRVYGDVAVDWAGRDRSQVVDLLALENGGRQIGWSDAHYGEPMNILKPGRGINMGDGWETRRRREPGNDWCILQLGCPGVIELVEVDTAHFKGNYPDRCSIQAARVDWGTEESIITQSMFWETLLPEQPLSADAVHTFASELQALGTISPIRLNIIPDGGISRLRLHGRPVPE
ncbi:MAG: allantoicase [Ectothiorhodospiraceae bacterium]|nr:allantoicase [Ectothiorhodospiraceae bacterium]